MGFVGGNGNSALSWAPASAASRRARGVAASGTMLGSSGGFNAAGTGGNGKCDDRVDRGEWLDDENLTLFQKAIGGDSGGSSGGSAGLAGNASSTINLSQNGVATLTLDSVAEAGSGETANTTGSTGGTTTAVGSLSGNGNLIAGAFARFDQFGNNNQQHGSTPSPAAHVRHRRGRGQCHGHGNRRGHWHHGGT